MNTYWCWMESIRYRLADCISWMKIPERLKEYATLKEYRGQHYGAAAITAAEEWFAERGVKKIFINSRTEAVGFYEKLGYVADPKQITGIGAFQCIMTEKQL